MHFEVNIYFLSDFVKLIHIAAILLIYENSDQKILEPSDQKPFDVNLSGILDKFH